ncbi:MAG: hypothetical protein H0T17_01195 [Propionibacteriales bacterium]|nr:hypothetical protein [Propionibacteriales bacterium]
MDGRETKTERLLARTTLAEALDGTAKQQFRVLVGGLGLGFTLEEVLDHPYLSSVVLAEIEPALVRWHRDGLVPASRIDDEKVLVHIGDIRDVVTASSEGDFDVVLLDVDNGPGFLVYDANAAVYQVPFLSDCRRVLRAGGVLAIWSADASEPLGAALTEVFGVCRQESVSVHLGRRETEYHVFLARRPAR